MNATNIEGEFTVYEHPHVIIAGEIELHVLHLAINFNLVCSRFPDLASQMEVDVCHHAKVVIDSTTIVCLISVSTGLVKRKEAVSRRVVGHNALRTVVNIELMVVLIKGGSMVVRVVNVVSLEVGTRTNYLIRFLNIEERAFVGIAYIVNAWSCFVKHLPCVGACP